MKKILFILLGLVLMFTLVACGEEKEPQKPAEDDPVVNPDDPKPDDPKPDDPKPEEGLTAAKLQEALLAVEKEYKESKKASVSVLLVNGDSTMNVTLTYELGADGLFKALQYELKGEKEIAIYVKDEVAYSSANGTKSKEDLDETVNETLTNDYGLEVLLKDVTAFYNEKGLYECLTLESKENGVYVFVLDLVKYSTMDSTKVFKTAGKDAIKIIVSTVNDKVNGVKVEITEGEKTLSTEVKYLGLDKSPVYPSDLDTYK